MATYYDQVFQIGPERSAAYLSVEKFVGMGGSLVWRSLEKFLLHDGSGGGDKRKLLRCRKTFAVLGFGINAFSAACMMWLHQSEGLRNLAPVLVSVLLCINSAGTAAHGFGFKTNYMDLTTRYSGAFMGVGNMFATFMTYVVPLGAAHLMEVTGGDWSLLFLGIALMNVFGAWIGACFTSVDRLDDEFDLAVNKAV